MIKTINPSKIQNKAVVIAHKMMLIIMLHSSFIAPSQSLISAYINRVPPLRYLGSSLPNYNTSLNETQSNLINNPYNKNNIVGQSTNGYNNSKPLINSNNIVIPFDIQHGVIGVSKQNPLDDPKDNFFKFTLDNKPESKKRYFLSYELYGVQDNSAVSRSINDHFATGGYIVKQQQSWSLQKEELNPLNLKTGINKIMFSIPKGAEYQYEVRNLKIEVQDVKENAVLPLLVLNNSNTTYVKNNKMYVKGFLRRANNTTTKVFIEDQPLLLNSDEFEGFITITPELKSRKFLVVKAIDSSGLLGQEIVPIDTLIEAATLFPIEPISNRVAKRFEISEVAVLEGDGASVELKQNSLSETKEISISKLRNIDIAPLSSGMINVTRGGVGYRFLPDGTKFKTPVLLKIAYDEKLLPKGYGIKDIKTFYFNTDSKSWVAVKRDTINEKEKTVSVLTTHFTDYINGIIQAPESPETAGFTSTMMNDIKAADPSSEMTIISPPEVSQKGDANVSYPIKIPAGRKGMQPQVALQYSSGGGNGWLGEGWNINIPSVSIDTRWGVPTFDPINESEIYSLGGEQLMYPKLSNDSDWMPNRHSDVNLSNGSTGFDTSPMTRAYQTIGNVKTFTPRKQGSFAKIERLGTSPSTYYWKVTNTDGSKNWYGGDASGIKENSIIRKTQNPLANNPDSTTMTNGAEIVHWGLYMSEDVYGNNVIYEYRNESPGQFSDVNGNLNGGNIFHLKTIFYTGFKSSKGTYSIIFEEDSNVRNDVSINANLGLKQIEPYVLKKVIIKNGDSVIRRYGFSYITGKFEKTLLDKATEFDGYNTEFYSHKFKYYDDVTLNGGYFTDGQTTTVCYENQPCPDVDGDTVCDADDACPLIFGPVSNSGCPIVPIKKCYELSSIPVPLNNITYNYTMCWDKLDEYYEPCTFKPYRLKDIYFRGNTYEPPVQNTFYITHFQPTIGVYNNCISSYNYPSSQSYVYLINNPGFSSNLTQWLNNTVFSNANFSNVLVGNEQSYYSYNANTNLSQSQTYFSISFNSTSVIQSTEISCHVESTNGTNGVFTISTIPSNLVRRPISGTGRVVPITVNGIFLGNFDLVNNLSGFIQAFRNQIDSDAIITYQDFTISIQFPSSSSLNTIKVENDTYNFDLCKIPYPSTINSTEIATSARTSNNNETFSVGPDFTDYYKRLKQSYVINAANFENTNKEIICNTVTNSGSFAPLLPGFNNTGAILGSSVSKNFNAAGFFGFGFDFTWNPFNKNLTFGMQYTHGWDLGESLTTLIDINGDGLDDVVYKTGGRLYWKKHNLVRSYDAQNLPLLTHTFEPYQPINSINDDISDFYKSRGESGSWNFQLNIDFGASAIFGYDNSHNYSRSTIYFSDANGDGLIDIIKDGVAYFNRIDSSTGNPYFETESLRTENMLISAEPIKVTTPIISSIVEDKAPNYDVVKMWEAPANGAIEIENTIVNNDPSKEVIITIEMKDNSGQSLDSFECNYAPGGMGMLYGKKLNSTLTNVNSIVNRNATNTSALIVKKGDRIYFRVHSIATGNPSVSWNPKINYLDNQLLNIVDANGQYLYSNEYSDGFILSQQNPIIFPGKQGRVAITWSPISVNNPSDSVTYEIIKKTIDTANSNSNSEVTIWSAVCNANQNSIVTAPTSLSNYVIPFSNSTTTIFLFKVKSSSNLDYKAIEWKPKMQCTVSNQAVTGGGSLSTIETKYPIPDYSIYKSYICASSYKTFDGTNLQGATINPNVSLFNTNNTYHNGTVFFVVKKAGHLFGKKTITVTNGVATSTGAPIIIDGVNNTNIEIGYYTDDSKRNIGDANDVSLLKRVLNSSYAATIISTQGVNTTLSGSQINLLQKPNSIYGSMYRQWGQFMYNPKATSKANHIAEFNIDLLKEELLVIGTNQANAIYENLYTTPVSNPPVLNPAITNLQNLDVSSAAFQQQIGSIQTQFNATVQNPFMVANSHRDFDIPNNTFDDKWIAMHQENYASEKKSRAAKLSQSYTIESQGAPTTTQAILVTGAYGIDKISEGSSETYCAGGNIGGVGASGNYSPNGINNSLTDYIDLNGDRYPDIVTSDEIQLTRKTGGLFPKLGRDNQGTISEDNSKNWGLSASGSFNSAGKLQKPGTGHSSLGLSGSYSNNSSNSSRIFTDINSDGLPDILTKTSSENASPVTVSLNLGNNNFSGPLSWGEFNLSNGKSENIGGGIGFNYSNASVEAGLNLGRTDASIKNTLIDINGDGMIDQIDSYNGNLNIRVNEGNKFSNTPINIPIFDYNNNSSTATAGLNGTYTYGFIVPLYLVFFVIPIKISDIGVTASGSTAATRTKKSISDFDGDGFPDLIEEVNNTNIRVYSSNIKRTNKLESVTNPLGGSFTIDYKVQPVNYNNPHPKWVMSSVEISDGFDKVNDGNDNYKKEYKYENGKYDRRERDFYGYETVSTLDYRDGNTTTPYRTSISKYHNESYFLNGLLKESYVMKGNNENQKYSKTKNFYEVRQLSNNNQEMNGIVLSNLFDVGGKEGRKSAAVVMTKTISELYELAPSPQITTQVEMQYDSKGRVINYSNLGNTALSNDNYSAVIAYHNLANNIINVPREIKVMVNGTTVRKRTTDVDPNTGSLLTVAAFNGNEISQTTLNYDQFGNVIHVEHPANAAGERMYYDYTYDSLYHKYVTNIKDAFGYSSSADYNSNFDKIHETIALTGNKMLYEYDTFGRNTTITAPKEVIAGKPYTIKFDYYPYFSLLPANSGVSTGNFVPVAVTSHYDQQHPGNDIQTYTFIDGLARPIQIKKDITLNSSQNHQEPNYYEALSVSGKTYFDEFGRAIKQFHPYFEAKTDATKFLLNEYASPYSATTLFDELDRPVKTIDPENNISTVEYTIDGANTGEVALKTKSTTDQNGSQNIVTETYKNVSGKVIATMNLGANALWTNFNYDAIGQLMNYKDAQDMVTQYEYDLLGRKIAVHHPDNGTTTFKYDTASNLIKLQTANLAADGTFVNYNYQFNRLLEIVYPVTPSGLNLSNVTYQYGSSGNDTGQLIYQSDATGNQEFSYGNMGEVVTNVRTVEAPNLPTRVFTTNYSYDSWNRLQYMIYPDQEKVNYNYDLGGNLTRMTGQVYNEPYNYVDRIDYDYYEQRTYLKYGNKTETFYNYTPALRRLENLNVKTSDTQDLYNNNYLYDKVGNVTSLINQAGATSNTMGGYYGHGFVYDNLNRLASASGYFNGNQAQQQNNNDFQSDYIINMQYNATHGIVNKTQLHYKNMEATPVAANTYSNTYNYLENTHKVVHIEDSTTGATEDFSYDLNGNLVSKTNTDGSSRSLFWDESNRLRVVKDPAGMQHYIYDASGERILKANSNTEAVYGNGSLLDPATTTINSYTTYPSANLVIDANGIYSKHYYAGTQRIVSRIGEQSSSIFGDDRTKMSENKDDNKLQELQKTNLQQILAKGKLGKATFKPYQPYTYDEAQKALAEEDKENLKETLAPPSGAGGMYFYHPDHLGTSTFLTDYNGNAYQFFLNLPFGETMAEQLGSNYYNTPYKFNGKELDDETGLYYYGARYYDPRVSIWLSVDPLAEKYPNTSPYTYCNNNPINLIDPDGKNPILPFVYYATAKLLENYGWNRNAKTVGYSMLHPVNAYRVGEYKKGSENISTISSNFEINIVKNTSGLIRGEEGTDGNAIRHAFWQAAITKDLGIDVAKRIGNAHEDDSNVDMKQRKFNSMEEADQTIDLLNNIIGRDIGENHPNASNQELAKNVIEEFHNNGLWKAKESKDGGYIIQKTKLTQKQYNEAINEVNKLKNDGLQNK